MTPSLLLDQAGDARAWRASSSKLSHVGEQAAERLVVGRRRRSPPRACSVRRASMGRRSMRSAMRSAMRAGGSLPPSMLKRMSWSM